MLIEKSPKIAKKFTCKCCDYNCSKEYDYKKHLMTAKHNKLININKVLIEKSPTFVCNLCKKEYKSNVGLWKHKKKCNELLSKKEEEFNQITTVEVSFLTNLVLEVVKNNNEMQKQHTEIQKQTQEIQKQMLEVCKNGIGNTTTNNNCYNKTFNMQVFLNEKCKDAMNLMDFVNSMTLELSDLEDVGTLGYVEGISNIIIRNLNALDIYKRPIHCSDAKREIMYVKDDNVWEKENSNYDKIRKAIKRVTYKNSALLVPWSQKYPACMNNQHHLNDVYVKMMGQAMGGKEDFVDSENKIMKKIAKAVLIDKALL
jgi:hypothetical protein